MHKLRVDNEDLWGSWSVFERSQGSADAAMAPLGDAEKAAVQAFFASKRGRHTLFPAAQKKLYDYVVGSLPRVSLWLSSQPLVRQTLLTSVTGWSSGGISPWQLQSTTRTTSSTWADGSTRMRPLPAEGCELGRLLPSQTLSARRASCSTGLKSLR